MKLATVASEVFKELGLSKALRDNQEGWRELVARKVRRAQSTIVPRFAEMRFSLSSGKQVEPGMI